MSPQDPNRPTGTSSASGQQKLHTIKNRNTGEQRQATQEEWRTNGKQLRAEGWERVDETTGEAVPEGTE